MIAQHNFIRSQHASTQIIQGGQFLNDLSPFLFGDSHRLLNNCFFYLYLRAFLYSRFLGRPFTKIGLFHLLVLHFKPIYVDDLHIGGSNLNWHLKCFSHVGCGRIFDPLSLLWLSKVFLVLCNQTLQFFFIIVTLHNFCKSKHKTLSINPTSQDITTE